MNVTTTVEPPFEPITLEDLYRSLRLDTEGSPPTHADDAILTPHITAARQDIEERTRRALVQQTIRVSYPGLPWSRQAYDQLSPARRMESLCALRLPRPPLVRVESVHYYDAENTLTLLSPSNYYVTDEQVAELRFTSSFVPPTVYNRPDAVRVSCVVGYAPEGSPPTTQEDYAANVPQQLKQAIILAVQCLYDDLQPADWTKIQTAIEALVQPKRVQLT
jgi:uncharacterized phiE125 gp8 family phage protein